MRIFVTNDDGVRAEGIEALATELEALGEVTVVAPLAEASGIGHGLTLTRPLRIEQLAERVYCVDGTPTDCVNLGLTHVLRTRPHLIISGINKGYNIGDDVTYSGTVAGALEGALLGIPALAISLERSEEGFDFSQAAAAAVLLASQVLERGLPPRTLLNVNVPSRPARGLRVTVQGQRRYMPSVRESVDPRERKYYWIEEGCCEWVPDERSDYQAVRDGWISVTPVHVDWTNHAALRAVDFVEGLTLRNHAEV
ncbi:MAG: 5'/3'-nucleotidase SurE [Luteitalea sp.]|nr:5'/3'-nucleotidase SurE [Luteitalea sp.]